MVRVISKKSGSSKFNGFVWSPEFGATIISVLVLIAIPVTVLLTSKQQDIRQHASSVNKTAVVSVSPSSGSYKVNEEFSVNVEVDGGSQSLDSVKANVAVSPNLKITSLSVIPATSGGCSFTFPNEQNAPSTSNPSFEGILPTSPITRCTLYTMTILPNTAGEASITISNAQATSPNFANENVIQSVTGATFTIVQ